MDRSIKLSGLTVAYKLRRIKNSKAVRIIVYPGGTLTVTAPKFLPIYLVEKFINQKSKWLLEKLEHRSNAGVALKPENAKLVYLRHKEIARVLAEEKLAKFNFVYKFRYNKVSIRNQATRWGSCSKKGNLSFNYKIALVPERVAEYIVVHELCHTIEFNHSKQFWNLVASTIPEYREIRRILKTSPITLN